MKQKLTSQLFLLIAMTGSVFLSYSCGCEEDSKTDPLGRPEIALSLQGPRLTEGGETTNSTLILSPTPVPTEDMTVSFIINGDDITREDFTLKADSAVSQVIFADSTTLSGTLVIEMGSANASLILTVSDDALDERAEETLRLTLNDSDSYSVNPLERMAEVILIDKKIEIALNLQDPRLTEGGETTDSTLTLSLTPALTEDMTVSFTISGDGITMEDFNLTVGSAISEVIFAAGTTLSGLTIEMGSTNADFTLTVSDDDLDERVEETLIFTLNDSDSYSVNPSAGAVDVVLIDNENRAEVTGLSSEPSIGAITLIWTDPVDMDLDHVEISWTPAQGNPSSPQQISRGIQTLAITGLGGGTTYTFTAIGVDSAGNRSSGVRINGRPMNHLTSVHNVNDSSSLELNGARSVTTASVEGETYLFVAGFNDSGISVFQIESGGKLVNVHNVPDTDTLELAAAISVTTASVGAETYLFVAGWTDDGVSVFRVQSDGILINVENVSDEGSLELDGARSVTTASVGGETYLFVAGQVDDGVSVFQIKSGGILSNVHNVSDSGSFELDGANSVTTASVGGETYLFVAGATDDGVSVFRVQSGGILSNVHNVSDSGSFELDGASSVTTASVGGETYLFVAGEADDGISVFQIESGGKLVNVDNVGDPIGFELNAAHSVTTASVGGETYLFVAGKFDDGVSVFQVQSNGELMNIQNIPDTGSLELNGAASVTTASVGGETYLFVAGQVDDGVSVFRVGPAASE